MNERITRRAALASLGALPLLAQDDKTKLWNGVYTSASDMVTPYPNRFLADSIRNLTPGKALDIGVGQGRNSLYLARNGWDVTGIDISDAGVEIARKQAERSKLKFTGLVADFTRYDLGVEKWDLVAGIYMGDLIPAHAKRIAASLRPGGHLIVENYHADLNRKGITGDPLGYPVNALLEVFVPLLRIIQYEEFRDFPDWGNRGEKVPLVHMLAGKG
jgi:SAM-dependent methyltransferase